MGFFYQPGTRSAPGWSYSYFAIFVSVCLFVCISVRARSGEARKRVNGCSWHVRLFRVSWFVRLFAAKGSKTMPVLLTVEAQLLLHKRNIAKAAPEVREWQETGAATYEQAKVRNCAGVTVLCVP